MKFHMPSLFMASAVAGIAGLLSLALDAPGAAAANPSGRQLYAAHCAACHGPAGKGDGRAACDFATRPRSTRQLRAGAVPGLSCRD